MSDDLGLTQLRGDDWGDPRDRQQVGDDRMDDRSYDDDVLVDDVDVPEYSPAVAHALITGRPNLAAAIHVLDGIDSRIFPRSAVTMGGIDWKPIGEAARRLSSGEALLVDAADELHHEMAVRWETLVAIRRTVDAAGNRRVDEAMRIVGQRTTLQAR